jgi:hypothetical protein
MSTGGVPDGPWKKARCPGCARWIAIRPKVGGFRRHKIGLKQHDPFCLVGGESLHTGAPVMDAMARVKAILDSWSEEDREAARKILRRQPRRR